jgi:hypothetical protein
MEQLKLSGADLTPLAHESTFSALLRMCWMNAFDEKVLAWILGIKRMYDSQSFIKPTWITYSQISSLFSWELPCKEEFEVLSTFGGLSRTFFSATLRICPSCMAASFHSYWHQFVLVDVCPVHKVELRSVCLHCGEPLPPYSLNRRLFGKPFHCHHCKQPFCGKEIKLMDHVKLRQNRVLFEANFGRLYSTLQASRDTVSSLQQLNPFHGGVISDIQNSFHADMLSKEIFLHAVADAGNAFVNAEHDITILSWKVNFVKSDYDGTYFRATTKAVDQSSISSVYRSTIRYLRNWIMKDIAPDEIVNDKDLKFSDGELQIGNFSSYVLAYHLTRMSFEDYACEPLSAKIRFFGLRFDKPIPNYSYEGRRPKLSWRAIFFSVFASMFWRVEQARANMGYINVRTIRTRTDPSVVKGVFRQIDNILSGYVVFPTVPLMPTSPFKRTQLGPATRFHELSVNRRCREDRHEATDQ